MVHMSVGVEEMVGGRWGKKSHGVLLPNPCEVASNAFAGRGVWVSGRWRHLPKAKVLGTWWQGCQPRPVWLPQPQPQEEESPPRVLLKEVAGLLFLAIALSKGAGMAMACPCLADVGLSQSRPVGLLLSWCE